MFKQYMQSMIQIGEGFVLFDTYPSMPTRVLVGGIALKSMKYPNIVFKDNNIICEINGTHYC